MFSKLALFTAASMAVFVAAAPANIYDSCNTGPVQCCNHLQSSDTPGFSELLSLVGVSLSGITGQVGVTCTPISVIGGGASSDCTAQPVCCSNNNFNGVVALGCSPINVGL
ncbi:hydrophobin-251 [Pholiota molesta]|nr:hydrophobin-251 [Pholiota molesta]